VTARIHHRCPAKGARHANRPFKTNDAFARETPSSYWQVEPTAGFDNDHAAVVTPVQPGELISEMNAHDLVLTVSHEKIRTVAEHDERHATSKEKRTQLVKVGGTCESDQRPNAAPYAVRGASPNVSVLLNAISTHDHELVECHS
jgi:hypothetical protein